jgi:SAM-dependent methyltransferase
MPLSEMQVSPSHTPCKCCDHSSRLCGVVDFSRCGADHLAGRKVDPYIGVPIYYYRCDQCSCVFTRTLDEWTNQDFSVAIYNADYVRHDPDYMGKRPLENAELISRNFTEIAQANLLDFGSGLGLLEKELKKRGFTDVDSYDPFTSGENDRNALAARYRTIVSFEVFEHHPQPKALMSELAAFLDDDGAILFSTLLASDSVVEQGIEKWWYCAPRNGHISFFTAQSLSRIGAEHGLSLASFSEGLHLFFKGHPPAWATKFAHQVWKF